MCAQDGFSGCGNCEDGAVADNCLSWLFTFFMLGILYSCRSQYTDMVWDSTLGKLQTEIKGDKLSK